MTVTNKNGKEIPFEAAVYFMDNGIREELHANIVPCTEQEFFTAYENAHENEFGEEWELSKGNPVW